MSWMSWAFIVCCAGAAICCLFAMVIIAIREDRRRERDDERNRIAEKMERALSPAIDGKVFRHPMPGSRQSPGATDTDDPLSVVESPPPGFWAAPVEFDVDVDDDGDISFGDFGGEIDLT